MKQKIIVMGIIGLLLCLTITPIINSQDIKAEEQNNNSLATSTGVNYYAVIAACANYEDPSANLPVGEYKLKKIYRGLISNENWKEENIILLINDNPDPTNGYIGGATKENIENALKEMAGKVTKNDVFLFSWQGHGSAVPESETTGLNDDSELDGYDEVICPWDCTRNSDRALTNYITDDELDRYFSNINADGMMLIFESCFSGGLINDNIVDRIFENDLDGKDRVVVVSTLDGALGRASWIFGFPMTWTIGDGFDQNSLWNGPAGEDFITAEGAFNWARPKVFAKNSIIWVGIFTYFFLIEYEFLVSQIDEEDLDYEAKLKAAYEAALESAKLVFIEFCYVQLMAYIMSGGDANGMFNWPHMSDRYNPLFGEKELIIVDNVGKTETTNVEFPLMPEIWTKPEINYEQFSECFKNEISQSNYEEIEWYDWGNMNRDSWPNLQAKADYSKSKSNKKTVDFTAEASNGPQDFTYNWDFGDETTSSEQNPTHNYENEGEYSVVLTVTDNEGRTVVDNINSISISKTKTKTKYFFNELYKEMLERFPNIQHLLSFLL